MAAKDDKFEHLNSLDEARTVHIESEKSALQAANAKLRRLNEARDDFLNELCHELRAPLISVMSFLEFLREDSLPPEEIKTLSGFLHCEVERLGTLVSDMLDLAKMEAGGLQHTYTEADLNDIAAQCISIVAIAAKRRNINLRLNSAPTLPSLALAANRIKQVIINMLDNALKHSKIGGEIVVTIENRPDDVCLSVRDFGLGIEPKDIQRSLAGSNVLRWTATRASARALECPWRRTLSRAATTAEYGFKVKGAIREPPSPSPSPSNPYPTNPMMTGAARRICRRKVRVR